MSDSDDDIITFRNSTYQTQNTTMWGKGPNMTTNLTALSFPNNILQSTMQMPTHYERPRFKVPDFDQRSVHSRRNISPMTKIDSRTNYNRWETSSNYGGCNVRSRNLNFRDVRSRNSNFRDPVPTMGSQRFVERSGSPYSVRSRGTYTSTGLQYQNNILTSSMQMPRNYDRPRFVEPNFDQRSIHSRRETSPMSYIDRRSNYNILESLSMYGGGDARPCNCNCRDSVRTMNSRSVYNGRSGSPFSVRSTASNSSITPRSIAMAFKNNTFDKDGLRIIKDAFSLYIENEWLQADIDKKGGDNGFGERRGRGGRGRGGRGGRGGGGRDYRGDHDANETNECAQNNTIIKRSEADTTERLAKNWRQNSDSEQDEIFGRTVREKNIHPHETDLKRSLNDNDEDNIYLPEKKRHKLSSPVKTNDRIKKTLPKQTNSNSKNKENGNGNVNVFEFVKPSLINKPPTRKFKAKVISNPPRPVVDMVQCVQDKAHGQISQPVNEDQEKLIDEPPQGNSTTDLSMRPSFIKRKLFTQKLDVTEKHNISGVNSSPSSPQANIYSAIQNEKHKSRKLVTSQSCLSRDVREDNNLLDLIHRIVPLEQMSVTNQTNKTETTLNKNSEDYNDRWDVTSIIETCNGDNVSDTYTDEEIFTSKKKTNDIQKEQIPASCNNNGTVVRDCNIGKLPDATVPINKRKKIQNCKTEVTKKLAQSYLKSFFGMDSESDSECTPTPKNLSHITEDQETCTNKPEPMNNIIVSSLRTQTLNNTHRKLSHHSSKENKCHEEPDEKDDSRCSLLAPIKKISKSRQNNKSVCKKQTALKNRKVTTENDVSKIAKKQTSLKNRNVTTESDVSQIAKKRTPLKNRKVTTESDVSQIAKKRTPLKNRKVTTESDVSQIAKKRTPLKNRKVYANIDGPQVEIIKTNRRLRTCRLNASQDDSCGIRNSNRKLQVIVTPIKIINKKIQSNIKMKEVDVRKSDVSFLIESGKNNPVVQKHADESPKNSTTREQLTKTKVRKSDVSFSLQSKKKTHEKKNNGKNNNNCNKCVDANFSMVLRSSSLSLSPEKLAVRKEVKSKARSRANGSKVY